MVQGFKKRVVTVGCNEWQKLHHWEVSHHCVVMLLA